MHDIILILKYIKYMYAPKLQCDSSIFPSVRKLIRDVKSQNTWCETDQGTPSHFLKLSKHPLKEENRIIWYHKNTWTPVCW